MTLFWQANVTHIVFVCCSHPIWMRFYYIIFLNGSVPIFSNPIWVNPNSIDFILDLKPEAKSGHRWSCSRKDASFIVRGE